MLSEKKNLLYKPDTFIQIKTVKLSLDLRDKYDISKNKMDAVAGPSAPLCLPPGGLFEIVFSFDTTGSMSRVIDEVKGRLQDMIQRLQADIPGIRFGVIAHGDYCDKDVFYLEQHVDLTTNIVELTDFVKNIEGTGGGDPEECYEYILWLARGYNWTGDSRKALVVIGDSVPHEADYDLNTKNLDWIEQTTELAKAGVKIYGVQAFDDDKSTAFFEKMATITDGQHLKLGDFSHICDFIMAICYREKGGEFLEDYEAEVRAREARKGLHKDLEGLFGVLRRGDSSLSNSLPHSPLAPLSPLAPSLSKNSSMSSAHSIMSSSSCPRTAVIKPIVNAKNNSKTAGKQITDVRNILKKKSKTVGMLKKNNAKSVTVTKYRHHVPDSKFILKKRNLDTRWSKWNSVLSSDKPSHGKNWVNRKNKVGYRKSCLFPRSDYIGRSLYEIAVQRSKGCKLYVMQAKWSLMNPAEENWENKLLGQQKVKDIVEKILVNGGKIFIRRFIPKGLGIKQNALVNSFCKGNLYRYAWSSDLMNPGKLSWAM